MRDSRFRDNAVSIGDASTSKGSNPENERNRCVALRIDKRLWKKRNKLNLKVECQDAKRDYGDYFVDNNRINFFFLLFLPSVA